MRKIYIITIIFILVTVMPGGAFSKEKTKKRIAVLNFNSTGFKKSVTDGIRDMIEVELYNSGAFEMLERNRLDFILKEQGYEDKNCSESDCAVKIGRVLSADKIIIGSVNGVGGINITIKFVDIKKGNVEYAGIERSPDEAGIMDSIRSLTGKMIQSVTPPDQKNKTKLNESGYNYLKYYSLGVVPGLGQLYAGNRIKGCLFFGGFAALAGFSCYAVYDFNKKREAYEDLKTGSAEDFDSKYNASGKALKVVKLSFGILGAFYLYNWVDIIFFNKPETEDEITTDKTKSVTIIFDFKDIYNAETFSSEMIYKVGLSSHF